jgi:translocation and assembly module TamB
MNAAGVLTGPLNDPVILAKLDINDGHLSRFSFEKFAGDIRYRLGTVDLDCRLAQDRKRSMILQGTLPIHRFAGKSVRDFPFFLHARSDSMDISWVQLLIPGTTDLRGILQIDLSIEGTAGNPHPSGTLQIINGGVKIPDLGLTIIDASAQAAVTPDSLSLTVLRLLDDKGGELRAAGVASLSGFHVNGLHGTIEAKRFNLIDTRDIKGVVKGTLLFGGTPDIPTVQGNIIVLRSEIPFPEETEKGPVQNPLDTFARSPLIRDLSCLLTIDVPRNLWIRSLNVNAEVEGNVNITKDHSSKNFSIFGTAQTVRGWYLYQGRSFMIERGEMTFQGGTEFDPEISIVGMHRLSGEDAQGEPVTFPIRIIVGGTLNKPQITLEANAPGTNDPLSETDIMAYLLFGRPANLSATETAVLENRAKNLLIGLAANRLKQTIGKKLGLDVIQIEEGSPGTEGQTRVRLGKYVNEGLYVSYSQSVPTGQSGQSNAETLREGAEVRVEYEVNNHLNVEGSMDAQFRTGLDLLLKFEW